MAVRASVEAAPQRRSLRALVGRRARRRGDVASLLDGLADAGWLVLHDVETPGGRTDHLAVGPAGVFAIAINDRRGRVSVMTIDERTYDEPYLNAREIEEAIGYRVTPVLVYPHAKLSRPVSKQRGVIVVTAKALREHLIRRRVRLTDAEVHSLYHQLVAAG